ncbi:hypothetical protein pkur_cds_700 [Pandoravirus kuranda]|uniref:F-box domain containing protein n=1 Tax=Pandoravirus kuranda TaxID=3019033 RepID=A0AA95EJ52_9VIRU|nr:hypothetical protein pkur_cds_700 [Pandoravirus kuranda]
MGRGIDDVPDEILVSIADILADSDPRMSSSILSPLRLVSRRWCAVVGEVCGAPVDPWVLGRCLQYLVDANVTYGDMWQIDYDTDAALVQAASEAGAVVHRWGAPLREPGLTDPSGPWPYDFYTCCVEAARRAQGRLAPWADLAGAERCVACSLNPTQCVCACPRHIDRAVDQCRDSHCTKASFGHDAERNRPRRAGEHTPGRHAFERAAIVDQPWFRHDATQEHKGRWGWVVYVARCYHVLVTDAVWGPEDDDVASLPCSAVVRNAHRLVDNRTLDGYEWGAVCAERGGSVCCTWTAQDDRCACGACRFYYDSDDVEEDARFCLDQTVPHGSVRFTY